MDARFVQCTSCCRRLTTSRSLCPDKTPKVPANCDLARCANRKKPVIKWKADLAFASIRRVDWT